jgi:hypothetical protein
MQYNFELIEGQTALKHPTYTAEDMANRVMRFSELKKTCYVDVY